MVETTRHCSGIECILEDVRVVTFVSCLLVSHDLRDIAGIPTRRTSHRAMSETQLCLYYMSADLAVSSRTF